LEASTYKLNSKIIKKTLDYKFDDFIEYNPSPATYYSIQKIEYVTGMCYGTCPMFSIELNKNGASKFIAKAFNFTDENDPKVLDKAYEILNKGKNEGYFEVKIKDADFLNFEDILNYINFSTLEEDYAVRWTDDQSCTLTITYDNGKTKTIKDYGLSGTYGLKLLYQKLFDLRFNQDWKKIK